MDVICALKTFLRVVETGSFSAAALDLGLTQPAVSRQVSALEAHYSMRLLHRSTNALSLTVEGEHMMPMALRAIEAVEALGETGPSEGTLPSGKVKVCLPAPLGLYLSKQLPAFLDAYPALTIEMTFREEASDLIGDGIDLEVRLGEITDNRLICRRIGWTTAYLVATPEYLSAHAAPVTPDEILGHNIICYSRGGEGRLWTFLNGADLVQVKVAPRMIFDNATAAHRATLSGGGLAVLSHILSSPDIAAGRLVNLMPDFPPARLPINVVYASRRHLPLRVRTVLDFIIEAVRCDALMGP